MNAHHGILAWLEAGEIDRRGAQPASKRDGRREPVRRSGWEATSIVAPGPAAAPPVADVGGAVITFIDDDSGYRTWIYANPSGYVVNTGRNVAPDYLQLHTASCDTIAPTPDKTWTGGQYIKVCSLRLYELEAWARLHGGKLSSCAFCNP